MRLDLFAIPPPGPEVDRYLTAWPGYVATRGEPIIWPDLKLEFDCVAIRLRCERCNKAVVIFGRALSPTADPRAVLWASLNGSGAEFFDDWDHPAPTDPHAPWHVHRVYVSCGSQKRGHRCRGEVDRNIDRIAERLDGMHATGRRAVVDEPARKSVPPGVSS